MAYLYTSNVSPRDRFTQIQLPMDNGTIKVLYQGQAYDLTASEAQRARRFVVLEDVATATQAPRQLTKLPILGNPEDGDVPVWDEDYAAFGLGRGGGASGLRFEQSNAALATSRPHHASGSISYTRARVTVDSAVSSTVSLLAVKRNGSTVATIALASGQTTAVSTVSINAVDGDAITITRLSLEGGGIVLELDNS